MKKFIAMLSAVLGLFMLGVFSQPQIQAASEKTYTIDTDVTFPPFVYANTENKYVGTDLDLLRAIAKEEGFKVKIRPVGFNASVQSVSAG
ncbi:MAG: transporter substrate-binding domain-containing protein, partial [Ligilactobacillus sp.]|nr:transporter substrate-binding domain-containing protein [Ligilactobacillus sp.]